MEDPIKKLAPSLIGEGDTGGEVTILLVWRWLGV